MHFVEWQKMLTDRSNDTQRDANAVWKALVQPLGTHHCHDHQERTTLTDHHKKTSTDSTNQKLRKEFSKKFKMNAIS